MTVHRVLSLCLSFAAAAAVSFACLPERAQAQETMPPDPDLPQPFDAGTFLPMIKNPPFNRVVNYTDSLLLTGVAWLEGKPMATLVDKYTKKRYVVSEEPNAEGWRLAEASTSNNLHGTEIKLEVGGETVTIRYSESQITPARKDGKELAQSQATTTPNAGPAGGRGFSANLSAADQDYYRKGMSKEARDKFRDTMKSHQDKMAKMTDDQRTAYSQKVFNKIKTQDQTGQAPAVSSKKAKKQ